MRLGMSPKAAAEDAIARIRQFYPTFSGAIIVVDAEGNHAGATNGPRTFPYTVQAAGMEAPEVVEVEPEPGYAVPEVGISNGVVERALAVVGDNSGTSLLVTMLVSAALGALGGYKLGGALGRSSKGARYTSVEGGD